MSAVCIRCMHCVCVVVTVQDIVWSFGEHNFLQYFLLLKLRSSFDVRVWRIMNPLKLHIK